MQQIMNNLIISTLDEMEMEIKSAIDDEQMSMEKKGLESSDSGKMQGLRIAEQIVKKHLEKFQKESFPVELYESDLQEKGIERLLERLSIAKDTKANFYRMVLYAVGVDISIRLPDSDLQYIHGKGKLKYTTNGK